MSARKPAVSGLGRRHDALVAAGAREKTYRVDVTLRLDALNPREAEDMLNTMVDGYCALRRHLGGHKRGDAPAVVVQQVIVQEQEGGDEAG